MNMALLRSSKGLVKLIKNFVNKDKVIELIENEISSKLTNEDKEQVSQFVLGNVEKLTFNDVEFTYELVEESDIFADFEIDSFSSVYATIPSGKVAFISNNAIYKEDIDYIARLLGVEIVADYEVNKIIGRTKDMTIMLKIEEDLTYINVSEYLDEVNKILKKLDVKEEIKIKWSDENYD